MGTYAPPCGGMGTCVQLPLKVRTEVTAEVTGNCCGLSTREHESGFNPIETLY